MGIIWFPFIVLTTHYGMIPGHVYKWRGSDFKDSFTEKNIMNFLVLSSYSIIYLNFVHNQLGKAFDLMKYIYLCFILLFSQILGTFTPILNSGIGIAIWCIIFGVILRAILRESSKYLSLDFYIKGEFFFRKEI